MITENEKRVYEILNSLNIQYKRYAHKRLTNCKFQNEKSTCSRCPIHCYKKDMRIKIKDVMRFSGPRILIYRPIEFLRHALNK